jgi:hypothetical protein
MQHTTHNIQYTINIQSTSYNLECTIYNIHYTVCNIQYTVCGYLSAIFGMREQDATSLYLPIIFYFFVFFSRFWRNRASYCRTSDFCKSRWKSAWAITALCRLNSHIGRDPSKTEDQRSVGVTHTMPRKLYNLQSTPLMDIWFHKKHGIRMTRNI